MSQLASSKAGSKNPGVALPVAPPVLSAMENMTGFPAGGGHNFGSVRVHSENQIPASPIRVQPKLTVNQPGDAHEQEADATAERVMRGNGTKPVLPTVQRQASPASMTPTHSPAVAQAIRSSGQPMDRPTRSFMEQRFGQDFGNIQIHNDAEAHRSSADIDALAYTHGNHVVFGAGQYQPGSDSGKSVLAHELTHTIQQGNSATTIQRKPQAKAPAKVFYQELLDEKAHVEKTIARSISGRPFDILGTIPALDTIISLAEAIDKKDIPAIAPLLAKLSTISLFRYQSSPSESLIFEMIKRLMSLGLDGESTALRTWYIGKEDYFRSENDKRWSPYATHSNSWWRILSQFTQKRAANADEAVDTVTGLTLLFKQIGDELTGLDQKQLNDDFKKQMDRGSTGFGMSTSTGTDSYMYAKNLCQLLIESFKSIQDVYQIILDKAMADLSARKGEKYLIIAKSKLINLAGLKVPERFSFIRKNDADKPIEITKSNFKKGNSTHEDAFTNDKSSAKRSVRIDFYDADFDVSSGHEVLANFQTIQRTRERQIAVLENIYGLETDQKGAKTADTQENAKALSQLGKDGLRLENDDDWRQFVLLKFTEHLKTSSNKTEALDSVISLLHIYLDAFTMHTPFNIDDIVENPFGKKFPRALTGQFIHDCGVYALRIAYILSLVRTHPALNLRFRMIKLPVHVALIITGEGLPAYIVNNDTFSKYSVSTLQSLETDWTKFDENGDERATPVKIDESKFMAELAGDEFIPGVDVPYKVVDVPKPSSNANQTKDKLWFDLYRKEIAKTDLFGKGNEKKDDPNYQFHLRYLNLLDLVVGHFNGPYLAYRNDVAHKRWLANKVAIENASSKVKEAKTADEKAKAQENLTAAIETYSAPLWTEAEKVTTSFAPIEVKQKELNEYIKTHPDVFGKGVEKTSAARLAAILPNKSWWTSALIDHLFQLQMGKTKESIYEDMQSPIAR